jgi:sensitive to high expression protein 9
MGVNVLLFLVFQFGFEPWRRRRLVHGFEEKVREALEKEKLAQAERRDGKRGEVEGEPLDGVLAAGIQELQNEMDDDPTNPDPAVDALVACIQGDMGQQEEEAALDTAEMHIPRKALHMRKLESWKAALQDLFSERVISMRKQDVTVVALEGAATGAAIVGIATLILRHS